MTQTFTDHFSALAATYAGFRPTYPPALFEWLAGIVPQRDLAWDCAAGSGQASVDLARHFTRVIATDASQAQIEAATPRAGVEYRLAPAEDSGLAASSVDLVTVAQALHWFDLERFYAEVRRVLRPAGVLAVWTYGAQTVQGSAVDVLVREFYWRTVGPYWPPERVHVEDGYRSLPFPFAAITPPAFAMEAFWTLPELLGYLRSWSATGRYIKANGRDPVTPLAAALAPLWGPPHDRRQVTWPLSLRVGRA